MNDIHLAVSALEISWMMRAVYSHTTQNKAIQYYLST